MSDFVDAINRLLGPLVSTSELAAAEAKIKRVLATKPEPCECGGRWVYGGMCCEEYCTTHRWDCSGCHEPEIAEEDEP